MADNSNNSKAHQTHIGYNLTGYHGNNINHVANSTTTKSHSFDGNVDSVRSIKTPYVALRSLRDLDDYDEDDDVPPYSLPPPFNPLPEREDFWMEVSNPLILQTPSLPKTSLTHC